MSYLKLALVVVSAASLSACGIDLGSDCVIICF